MKTVKPWWQSRAVWGAILTLVSSFGIAGISYIADDNMVCADLDTLSGYARSALQTAAGGGIVGGLISLIGRLKASTKIGW